MDATGTWQLAPAYDLNYSAGPAGEHYLTVNGRGAAITGDDITAVAARQDISSTATRAIVDDVLAAVAGFERIAAGYAVPRSSRNEIAKVLDGHVNELRAVKTSGSPRPRERA
jgi:serine/threonine-protein kinase HipA